MNEYALALRARDGDREALAELVERTRLRLFNLAYAELRQYEDAQDAVAAALLQICRHIGELREPERVRAWMQSIVRREVYRLRRSPRASLVSLEEAAGPIGPDEPSLLRLDIERALKRLPGDQAQAIQLYYLDELSTREIARRLGRAEGTITSWLHRGRRHLAAHMEDYAPMASSPNETKRAPEPARLAALIHTDLEPDLVRRVTDALQAGGYAAEVVIPEDLPRVLEPPAKGDDIPLARYRYLVMDETMAGRSALELLVNIRANPEIRSMPLCVLCSQPSEFTASAYFCSGADRLVTKEDPAAVAALGEPIDRSRRDWRRLWGLEHRHTQRFIRLTFSARDVAERRGAEFVETEHLLLALIEASDCAGARVLTDQLGISLEQIRSEIDRQATNHPIPDAKPSQCSLQLMRARRLAETEARRLDANYVGSEHLLLGLIREGSGLAARVLTGMGADLERARQAVREAQGSS